MEALPAAIYIDQRRQRYIRRSERMRYVKFVGHQLTAADFPSLPIQHREAHLCFRSVCPSLPLVASIKPENDRRTSLHPSTTSLMLAAMAKSFVLRWDHHSSLDVRERKIHITQSGQF